MSEVLPICESPTIPTFTTTFFFLAVFFIPLVDVGGDTPPPGAVDGAGPADAPLYTRPHTHTHTALSVRQ